MRLDFLGFSNSSLNASQTVPKVSPIALGGRIFTQVVTEVHCRKSLTSSSNFLSGRTVGIETNPSCLFFTFYHYMRYLDLHHLSFRRARLFSDSENKRGSKNQGLLSQIKMPLMICPGNKKDGFLSFGPQLLNKAVLRSSCTTSWSIF